SAPRAQRKRLPTPFLPLIFPSRGQTLSIEKTPDPFCCPFLARVCAQPQFVELATDSRNDTTISRLPRAPTPPITAPAAGRPRGQRPRPGGPGLPSPPPKAR